MKLDGATFLLQWATGGLLFGWVTTRRREVSLGYGWLLRIMFGLMALGAVRAVRRPTTHTVAGRRVAARRVCVAAAVALAVSVHAARRRACAAREELRAGAAGRGSRR